MKPNTHKPLFLLLLIITFGFSVFAENTKNEQEGFNPTPQILHHIADSYEWHLWGKTSIPLPVILYTDGKIDFFMSSEFNHGKEKVISFERIDDLIWPITEETQGRIETKLILPSVTAAPDTYTYELNLAQNNSNTRFFSYESYY